MSDFKEYPKMIDHPTEVDRTTKDGNKVMKQVLVNNAKEEAEITGKAKGWDKSEKKSEPEKKKD